MDPWAHATDEQRRGWLQLGRVPRDYTDPVAADWPHLLRIVEERVKPERMKVNRKIRRDRWWQYGDRQPALYAAIAGLERVLAISRLGQHDAFAFLSAALCSRTGYCFPLRQILRISAPSAVPSPRDLWARFFGSTMKDDLLYTPSDCFETFPVPRRLGNRSSSRRRRQRVLRVPRQPHGPQRRGADEDLQPFPRSVRERPGIATLRELHAAMDRAVLDAYGWTDIPTDCEFLLDYEIDEEECGAPARSPTATAGPTPSATKSSLGCWN